MDLLAVQLHSMVKEAPMDECKKALQKMPLNKAIDFLKKTYSKDSGREQNINFLRISFPEKSDEELIKVLDKNNNDVDDAFQFLLDHPNILEDNKKKGFTDMNKEHKKHKKHKHAKEKKEKKKKKEIIEIFDKPKPVEMMSITPLNKSANIVDNDPIEVPKNILYQPSSLFSRNLTKSGVNPIFSKVAKKNPPIFKNTIDKTIPKKPLEEKTISQQKNKTSVPSSIVLPRIEIDPKNIDLFTRFGFPSSFIYANMPPPHLSESSEESDVEIMSMDDNQSQFYKNLNNKNKSEKNNNFYNNNNNSNNNNYTNNDSYINNTNYTNNNNNYHQNNNFNDDSNNDTNNYYQDENNNNNNDDNGDVDDIYYVDEDSDTNENFNNENNSDKSENGSSAPKFSKIDLHGYFYKDAKFIVETAIINAKTQNIGVFHFVTGIGNNSVDNVPILRPMVMDVCKQNNVKGYISKNNPGIVVCNVNKPFS